MGNKADHTAAFILETATPILNQKGYLGTSMSDITSATGLTKGAIYGNFKSKEHLAASSLSANLKIITNAVLIEVNKWDSPTDQLLAIVNFYRGYYKFSRKYGGCPVTNAGPNAAFQNTVIGAKMRKWVIAIQDFMKGIIQKGVAKGELKSSTDSELLAARIYGMLTGGVFMTELHQDQKYLDDIILQLTSIIQAQKV